MLLHFRDSLVENLMDRPLYATNTNARKKKKKIKISVTVINAKKKRPRFLHGSATAYVHRESERDVFHFLLFQRKTLKK